MFFFREMIQVNKPSIVVVGAGKVGSALALLLSKRGYRVIGVADRDLMAAKALAGELKAAVSVRPEEITGSAEIVFITTPDRVIARTAEEISAKGGFSDGQLVFHTSGAHSAEELGAARRFGAAVASLHPLQSFAGVQMAIENLTGSYFALEGDAAALLVAEQIVKDLGGRSFTIAARDKPLYHAAACIASNYLVSLLHLATGLYGNFGLSRQEAFQALMPLVQGTISNIAQVGPAPALTGPIARGDGITVTGHMKALEEVGKQERELYRVLGLYTLNVALEKGSINQDQKKSLAEILEEAYVK